MSGVDLRPLSLGEFLDRTFSLYRSNLLFFIRITAIPQLLGQFARALMAQWTAPLAG